jgi:hypothetical protein
VPRYFGVKMTQNTIIRTLLAGLPALLLGAGGCLMQPDYAVSVTTADGVKIDVPLTFAMKKIDVADDAIALRSFQFVPLKMEEGKGIGFAFALEFKNGSRPVTITVDDVSEEPILSIYANNDPKLKQGAPIWVAVSKAFHPADEHAKWIMTLDNGVKVYRFTVKLADGSTHVLRFPIFVTGAFKTFLRAELGAG